MEAERAPGTAEPEQGRHLMAALPRRRFRRFVRRQRSPLVARWLRWSQVIRELPPGPLADLVTIEGNWHSPRAVLVHASREAIAAPSFPEIVEALTAGLEATAAADGWNAFPRYGTASYWCRLCDTTGPGLLADHFLARHPDELPPPVDVRAALRTGPG